MVMPLSASMICAGFMASLFADRFAHCTVAWRARMSTAPGTSLAAMCPHPSSALPTSLAFHLVGSPDLLVCVAQPIAVWCMEVSTKEWISLDPPWVCARSPQYWILSASTLGSRPSTDRLAASRIFGTTRRSAPSKQPCSISLSRPTSARLAITACIFSASPSFLRLVVCLAAFSVIISSASLSRCPGFTAPLSSSAPHPYSTLASTAVVHPFLSSFKIRRLTAVSAFLDTRSSGISRASRPHPMMILPMLCGWNPLAPARMNGVMSSSSCAVHTLDLPSSARLPQL
mmetsp:Transcript_37034/g.91523  ORF Transcript_37034/g.91523 Transcript_37034/m.91523 type:complete len:287 (+) Transcript_37034:350-1210(+)